MESTDQKNIFQAVKIQKIPKRKSKYKYFFGRW